MQDNIHKLIEEAKKLTVSLNAAMQQTEQQIPEKYRALYFEFKRETMEEMRKQKKAFNHEKFISAWVQKVSKLEK